jgi:hypothetical protein
MIDLVVMSDAALDAAAKEGQDHVAQLLAIIAERDAEIAAWSRSQDEQISHYDGLLGERDARIKVLEHALQNINECWEAKSELYTSDQDCAGTLAAKARFALEQSRRAGAAT